MLPKPPIFTAKTHWICVAVSSRMLVLFSTKKSLVVVSSYAITPFSDAFVFCTCSIYLVSPWLRLQYKYHNGTIIRTTVEAGRGLNKALLAPNIVRYPNTVLDTSQQTHDVYTTSSQRRCNVMTLHRR